MLKSINITGHSTIDTKVGKKHIVLDDKLKYEFFENKRDGNETKAFGQWKTYALGEGQKVTAEVSESAESFVKEGKEINYTRRMIIWFEGDEHGAPYVADGNPTIEDRLKKLEGTVFGPQSSALGTSAPKGEHPYPADLVDDIKPEDLPF